MTKLILMGRAAEVAGRAGDSWHAPIRLCDPQGLPSTPNDAALVRTNAEAALASQHGFSLVVAIGAAPLYAHSSLELFVRLPDPFSYLAHGDVIGLTGATKSVRTLYRASSSHNWFFVTERCDNYCLMCSQPPRKVDDAWLLDEIAAALPLIGTQTRSLGFTGGEPLLNWPSLTRVLRLAEETLPSTLVHVLSNGRAFHRPEIVKAWADVGHPHLTAGIPVYSGVDTVHDYVVQAKGAFAETIEGILRLKDAGQRVEIRIVLHKITAERLVETATWLARNLPFVDHVALMGMENTGFALANDPILWIDPAEYRKRHSVAVDILKSADIRASIYNLPLCLVDERVWDVTVRSISDWKNGYLEQCAECAVKSDCAGFFTSGSPKLSHHIAPVGHSRRAEQSAQLGHLAMPL